MSLSRSAAVEYARDKIRVNAICPAMIETPLVAHLLKTNPDDFARVLAVTTDAFPVSALKSGS